MMTPRMMMMSMAISSAPGPVKVKDRPTTDYLEVHREMKKLSNGNNPTLQQVNDYMDGLRFDREAATIAGNMKVVDQIRAKESATQLMIDHFEFFAKQDGDGKTLSAADIKKIAARDGNAKNISAKDVTP